MVRIRGKPANVDVETVKKAVKFYASYLLGEKLLKSVDICVEFQSFKKGSDEYAWCDWDLDNHRSRDFTITINRRLSKKETLMALAHEMVHVKQYAKGELKDLFRPVRMVRWKGERYLHEKMDYWEQPWEIEAYGREKGLYIKFISHLDEDSDGNIQHDDQR